MVETPVQTYKTGNLIQMMQEQIKDQEERKKSFGKQGKQKTFKNSVSHHRVSPSVAL